MKTLPLRSALLGAALLGTVLFPQVPAKAERTYVGSLRCAHCHADKYALLQKSIHSKMIRTNVMDPGVVHGNLSAPKAPTFADFNWVMGGHYKEESYIQIRTNDPMRPYWVTRFQWNPIPANYSDTQDGNRDWLKQCAGCHTTGYNPALYGLTNQPFVELNIGCEACHGPGSEHAARPGQIPALIDRSNEGCGFCHIRAKDTNNFFNFPIGYQTTVPSSLRFNPEPLTVAASFYPDGTPNRHREQFLDFLYPGVRTNAHHRAGVTCVSCHDPHSSGIIELYANALPPGKFGIRSYDYTDPTKTNYYAWGGDALWHPQTHAPIAQEDLCQSCHTSVANNHVHKFNAAASAAQLTCTDCHQPDVINIDAKTLRGALTAHSGNPIMPSTSMKYGPNSQPNSCTYRCHQDKGADKVARAKWADSILTLRLYALRQDAPTVRVVGTPDYSYAVEASSDFKNWTVLSTNLALPLPQFAPRWGFELSDPEAASGYRFYRARAVTP